MSFIFRRPSQVPYYRSQVYIPSVRLIQFDASSNSGSQTTSSYSWNHTCNGNNRFLSVDIAILDTGITVSSITYDGVSLSPIVTTTTALGARRIASWGLVAPSSGTHSISVTLSGSSSSVGMAVSYTDVHQTVPTEASNSNSGENVSPDDAVVVVTTVVNHSWVHSAVVSSDTAITSQQNSRNNVSLATGSGADSDSGNLPTPIAKTMNFTNVGSSDSWAIVGYALRPIFAVSQIIKIPIFMYQYRQRWR